MLFRKQPFGFYLQKLKAVFVFTGLVLLYQLFRNPPTENTSLKSKEVSPWVKQSHRLDSLLTVVASSTTPKLRSFYPNFLTDYRAYRLDLPTDVVDRIKAYHAAGKWITDRSVFQKVTGISDSSYERIAPYLKYPPSRSKSKPFVPAPIIKKDLNHATALELQKVRGIGPVLSERIVVYRDRIQAFSNMEQLAEVYGLSEEVRQRLILYFEIQPPLPIVPLAFANASLERLTDLPYMSYKQARWLVAQRTQQPEASLDELLNQTLWDSIQVRRIKLYLY